MKSKNKKNILGANILLVLLAAVTSIAIAPNLVTAKSLYVIADIIGATEDITQPVQSYNIGVDGTLTFQAQYDIPHRTLGAVGMAIDSDSGYVFITYEDSNVIQLLNPVTMTDAGTTTAPDARDLAGIVYDHDKSLLYCVDRLTSNLYVYNWFGGNARLSHVPGSPFRLSNASAYGIALDEIDDLLYVANFDKTVTVYRTSDWSLVDTITLSRAAISIAVDVKNGFIYTGGGYVGNMFLTQYHLATGIEAEVQVEPDAGVMGLGVDADTGLIYISTGRNNQPGGDNLLVYDKALNQIDIVTAIGNPTGLAIPGKDIGYNPLNLRKQVLRGADANTDFDDMKTVGADNTYTYGISFENNNDFIVTDMYIVDILPKEVTFVTADDDGVNGQYDAKTHTYTWTYMELPPGTSVLLEITVQVNPDIDVGTVITNWATISTNETPPTTKKADVMSRSNALNLKKRILGVPEGQIARVNSNDIITYIIEFDNKDNDFPVTNVILVDELPRNVTFISAEDDKGIGRYDDKAHTYTWTFDSLGPGEVVHLELVVSVNPNLAVGTTITNVVTIDSNETLPEAANVDIWVEDIRLEVDNLEISTDTISYDDSLVDITFILELPEGIEIDDVIDEPLILYPAYIEAFDQQITEADGRVKITAVFDKYELLNAMPDHYGLLDLTLEGILKSGQTFFGEATITISQAESVSDYISDILITQLWDYGNPTDDTDLVYEFYLEIFSYDYMAMNMDINVKSAELITPAGNTFPMPKLPNYLSDSVWISYEYNYDYDDDYDFEWYEAIWKYGARFTDPAGLQAYGDGEYTIILHYNDGTQSQTTVWFGNPDTQESIPQPTQEPVFTSPFPFHKQTVESPVTLKWELCTDPNAEYVYIDLDELSTVWRGDKWGEFDKTETSWDSVDLLEGLWNANLVFSSGELWEQPWSNYNNDGIWIDAVKLSRSRYRFIVEGSPWTTYEIWGGNTWIYQDEGSYGNIVDLEMNDYVKLGKSDGQTKTFSGQYDYYLIATKGRFLLDSIQGSDGSYYSSFEANMAWANISNDENILGPPDRQFAAVGVSNPWDDYSGYLVFTNPGNWEGLTVITSDLNLNLSKSIVSGVDESEDISPNDTITYRICFDSNDLSQDITDITVVDILPDEVSFVSADSNEVSGFYNPDTHTYTWSYPLLAPESAIETQLIVQVNPNVVPGTTITNFVTINSNETPPLTTSVNILVREILKLKVNNLSIIPEVLRRDGTSPYITAVIQFPEGIQQNDIDQNNIPSLYYRDQNTGEFIFIGNGSRPNLSGTEISTSFNRAELMDAVYGYGEFTLRVEGKLKTGQSYYGEYIIYITRFTGD